MLLEEIVIFNEYPEERIVEIQWQKNIYVLMDIYMVLNMDIILFIIEEKK